MYLYMLLRRLVWSKCKTLPYFPFINPWHFTLFCWHLAHIDLESNKISTFRPNANNLDDDEDVDMEEVEEFYRNIFSDLNIDRDESQELYEFFESKKLPSNALVAVRAAAFKVACEFLADGDTETNVTLMRCINFVVHIFEKTYLE